MRLDKYLSEAGEGSRSQVKELIRNGLVSVNGEKAARPEYKVEEGDQVSVSGRQICLSQTEYWMLYKPTGCVSATEDLHLPTVLQLLPPDARKDLFPVGRLDRDTEGLMLLTNDGALAHRLLSPRKHVDKTYYAVVRGVMNEETIKAFQEGLDIGDDKKTLPAKLRILSVEQPWDGKAENTETEIEITIREGRFHQVKRMCASVGCQVLYLKRLSMGSLKLDERLIPGESRLLTEDEIDALKEETGC